VKLGAMGDARRAQGKFPSANQGSGVGEGKEDVGGSDVVVVEKIGDIGFEVIGVEDPSAVRDGDAELMFFVALTVERLKTKQAACCRCRDSSGPETVSMGGA
jgi:hypothetical protein